MRPCNLHILKTLELAEEMIHLADRGEADREDNGCGILYGVLRDSAYKLKKLAEEEGAAISARAGGPRKAAQPILRQGMAPPSIVRCKPAIAIAGRNLKLFVHAKRRTEINAEAQGDAH